ncbi:hypothetical protein ACFFX0_03840 [Citricoccus parietis]|uniref:Uncharacterized protein n=1 Tax=Citricoccus parietis TaxID=592307 RepID=A0ABV5FUK5_9MICC
MDPAYAGDRMCPGPQVLLFTFGPQPRHPGTQNRLRRLPTVSACLLLFALVPPCPARSP